MRRTVPAVLAPLLLAGCGTSAPAEPPDVRVVAGGQDITVPPSQYCLDGEGQRYQGAAPIIEVSPDTPVSLTVPAAVAEHGWSVQVYDEQLEELIGEVEVPEDTEVFSEINTSDVVPPAFYLVVVEDKGGDCGPFSGAWPIGFLRAGSGAGA